MNHKIKNKIIVSVLIFLFNTLLSFLECTTKQPSWNNVDEFNTQTITCITKTQTEILKAIDALIPASTASGIKNVCTTLTQAITQGPHATTSLNILTILKPELLPMLITTFQFCQDFCQNIRQRVTITPLTFKDLKDAKLAPELVKLGSALINFIKIFVEKPEDLNKNQTKGVFRVYHQALKAIDDLKKEIEKSSA